MGGMAEDSQLATQAGQGDMEAFSMLVAKHQEAVFNLALRMTGVYQDAEDLAQDTFLRIHAKLGDSYDPERPFAPWMFAICLNLVRDHLRKKSRGRKLYEQEQPAIEHAPGPEEKVADAQSHHNLGLCLAELPVSLRGAVVMRYYLDLSFADIAAAMGVSLSTAKMRVYRGLDKLRAMVGNGAQGGGIL
ncbi:MAG: RNA polymerase sigma factor [Desulfovibrio sp.]|nr:MAG: RNA polymerase sigma factor [Desulfovibrio sp.]